MTKTKIKICGVTNVDDARVAIENGAQYVGLIFAPSKRRIIKETALRIIEAFPEFTNFVAVFLNGKKRDIETICAFCGIKIIQFHGEESPAFCNYFKRRGYTVFKAFRIKDESSFSTVAEYDRVDAYLFDTYVVNQHGGTGVPFDWTLLRNVPFLEGKEVFISGGLDEGNVGEVVRLYPLCNVDASSCLEESPGKKDHDKVLRFIASVRAASKGNSA